MAGYNFKWYEDLPTPWDIDCRGKFPILKTTHPLESFYEKSNAEAKFHFYKHVRELLEESGKLEFLKGNGIDLGSLRITGTINQASYQLHVLVLIDLPLQLRTLYALRFTE